MMHFSLRMIHFHYWALRLVQIIITFMSYYHLLIGSLFHFVILLIAP
jgi:hypothetical protein